MERAHVLTTQAAHLRAALSATIADSVSIGRLNPRWIRGRSMSEPGRNVEELRSEVRAWLTEGSLPPPSGKVYAGPGIGNPCSVCHLPIVRTEVEHEVRADGVALFSHILCYEIWRDEAVRLDGESVNGHATGDA